MLNNIPPVTKNLLLVNVTLYIVSMVLLSSGIDIYKILSGHYVNSVLFEPYQAITHMFMHSHQGIRHIFFNMFALVLFGSHLERIWGAKRYFIFYIASGLGAFLLYNSIGAYHLYNLKNEIVSSGVLEAHGFQNIAQFRANIVDNFNNGLAFTPEFLGANLFEYQELNRSSLVGASGAIFGLLAGFTILFPNTELQIILINIKVKAKYLIGGYIAFEVFNSFLAPNDSIAHLAHVGGAIVGAAFVLYWRKFDKKNFY